MLRSCLLWQAAKIAEETARALEVAERERERIQTEMASAAKARAEMEAEVERLKQALHLYESVGMGWAGRMWHCVPILSPLHASRSEK